MWILASGFSNRESVAYVEVFTRVLSIQVSRIDMKFLCEVTVFH